MGQNTKAERILLIGGSSGSLEPLRSILGALPPDVPAAVFVVLHVAATQARPTVLIAKHTALKVNLAEDGMRFSPGEVYIAPGDRHLALEDGIMRVYRGPRENGARPSIDVLFRSAAVCHGARVVGVLLSGALHDGSLGLQAVRRCGGISVVQAPKDALYPALPRNALQAGAVDHCVASAEMPALLIDTLRRPAPESPPVPDELQVEARAASRAADPHSPPEQIGEAVPVACPECGGPLSQVAHEDSYGYRCHLGHAYHPRALLAEHGIALERALWTALRALKERAVLLAKMVEDARARGYSDRGFADRLEEIDSQAAIIHRAIATINEPPLEEGLSPGLPAR